MRPHLAVLALGLLLAFGPPLSRAAYAPWNTNVWRPVPFPLGPDPKPSKTRSVPLVIDGKTRIISLPELKHMLHSGKLRVDYGLGAAPNISNVTYGDVLLLPGQVPGLNATGTPIPSPVGTIKYFLAQIYVTFVWPGVDINITVVPFAFQDSRTYGQLPPVQMLGKYVITGLNQPTAIFISFANPASCSQPAGGFCCGALNCPFMSDYYQDFFQLAMGVNATTNTTSFVSIGNPGLTFGDTPDDLTLSCQSNNGSCPLFTVPSLASELIAAVR